MSSDGATELYWGGEPRRFKFGIGQFRELQDRINARRVKTGAALVGPMALVLELRNKNAWPDDVRDVLRIGLSGGGLLAEEAHRLCVVYFDDFAAHSFVENTVTAHAALLAGLVGPPAPDEESDISKKKDDVMAPIEFGKLYGAGAAVGFTPADVDACSFWQFGECVEGWKKANGATENVKPPSDLEFEALLERHGLPVH